MPRLIFKCPYIKGGTSSATAHLENYVKYMATRNGVERIDPGRSEWPATSKQKKMVEQILRDFPLSRGMFEYEDYAAEPTRANASEFITRALEDNYDQIAKKDNYLKYIATRPRAQRVGSHGLFTGEEDQLVLAQVAEAVAAHPGNVWLPIISLRREDAARLGYDKAEEWKALLSKYAMEMAEAMKIPWEDFRWYAAFHDEAHHPHIHMVCYSADPSKGFLTTQGIAQIKSGLAKEIFRQELTELYQKQTQSRNTLNEDARSVLEQLIEQMWSGAVVNHRMEKLMEHLAELSAQGGKTLPGLSTGFSAVDGKINGLNKSDLLLLAARPGMGKTSMALNVALNAAKESGQTVAVFSLEMSRDQLVTRLLASEGLIENTRLISGDLRESDWVKIAEGASSLSRLDIRIDDNPLLTVADMNAKCRRIENLGLVVIDYLQLMTSAGGKGYSGENRQQAVSDISRMLKIMAKELQVPVLCLSQLSRANEKREDKRPMLSDLRESGAIEQDADIVMFLYRDDYYKEDSEKRNIAECIVAKNRHGETGKVELRWMPEYTTFGTLENRYDEE